MFEKANISGDSKIKLNIDVEAFGKGYEVMTELNMKLVNEMDHLTAESENTTTKLLGCDKDD